MRIVFPVQLTVVVRRHFAGSPSRFANGNCRLIQQSRAMSSGSATPRALVLGVYDCPANASENAGVEAIQGTPGYHLYDSKLASRLSKTLISTGYLRKKIKCGSVRVINNLDHAEYDAVVVVGLGSKDAKVDDLEQRDEKRENVRIAAAAAAKTVRDLAIQAAVFDTFGDAEAVAEGSHLSLYEYDELKASEKRKDKLQLIPLTEGDKEADFQKSWEIGSVKAAGQNYARRLMEMPANLKLAPQFAEMVAKELSERAPNLAVQIRDEKWIDSKKMGAIHAVAKGSSAPPRLLEISYSGAAGSVAPLAVVGKGITFDTGGISLKPSANMDLMRGDMGGMACGVAAVMLAAQLKLPINVLGIFPICENMPGGNATRPGDVVTAMNGKTIQIDNTDAEGRLILADALCYAQEFNPSLIVDLATLTGAIRVALGAGAAGVYSNDLPTWETLRKASITTGDRVWLMPLFKTYAGKMTKCHLADINNIGGAGAAGSCTAAGFLREFVKKDVKWMHWDIAGVSGNDPDDVPYLPKGFSGRPTRTLVEFFRLISQQK